LERLRDNKKQPRIFTELMYGCPRSSFEDAASSVKIRVFFPWKSAAAFSVDVRGV